MTATRPLHEGLFRSRPDGSIVLVGGYSATSGRTHFPRLAACPYSGADDVEEVELPTEGRLWGWTAVTARPPGYDGDVPFGFGIVELTDGLRVVTRLTVADPHALTYGQPVHLVPDVLTTDDEGTAVVTYAFAPDPGGDEGEG